MKKERAVTIIGGADGPTSVFIASKANNKNIFRYIKNDFLNRRYKKKRRKIEAGIIAKPHTLQEVVHYITKKYGAVELGISYHKFECMKKDMKASLVQKKQPNLLGTPLEKISPQNLENEEVIKKWFKKVNEYNEKAINIPDEVFPTDYHLYEIKQGKTGELHVEIDFFHELLRGGYSGDLKVFKKMWKDIYLFYGVSEEDIALKTERYMSLVIVLLH
ncbi:MAG: hypothetical protein ACERKN_18655 [Velocimicrobium sp.]